MDRKRRRKRDRNGCRGRHWISLSSRSRHQSRFTSNGRHSLTRSNAPRRHAFLLVFYIQFAFLDPKQSITCYAAGALHNLIDGSTRNKIALRAAGAIPRVVQLLDGDPLSPIVEVSVRILQKLSEKFEDAQADIRRNGGIGKLVELQTKSLLQHFALAERLS